MPTPEGGNATKLVRLARLPRLVKLLKLLKLLRLIKMPKLLKYFEQGKAFQFIKTVQGGEVTASSKKVQYILLYIYRIFKIMMMAIFMTYFSGCAFYFFSNEIYSSIEETHYHDQSEKPDSWYASYIKDKESLEV